MIENKTESFFATPPSDFSNFLVCDDNRQRAVQLKISSSLAHQTSSTYARLLPEICALQGFADLSTPEWAIAPTGRKDAKGQR